MSRHGSPARRAVRPVAPTETDPDTEQVVYVGYRRQRKARVQRLPDEEPLGVGPSRGLATHSREFEWGYAGSGPAQLSLAILLDYYDEEDLALDWYQQFCTAVVSDLETDATGTWRLTGREVDAAIAEIREDDDR